MTQAVAYREGTSGQEAYSSGLIIHRGPLTAALVRAIGAPATGQPVWPRDGQGSGSSLELAHVPKQYSNIQSYDRDTSTWLDLNLFAKNITLWPQGGKVSMPQGSAQAPVGQWLAGSGYTVPQANVWAESDVRVNCTLTGAPIRIEYCATLIENVGAATTYLGIGIGGALTWPSVGAVTIANAGWVAPVSGVVYHQTPPTGAQRVSIWIYSPHAGCGIWSGVTASLFVTEQRA